MQSACAILSAAYPAPVHFSTLYLKRQDFRGKKLLNTKTGVLIFSTTFFWNISHSDKNSATYCHKCQNVFMQSTPYPCRNLMKLGSFSTDFRKTQIRPVGAELFHAGGQTDGWTDGRIYMTKRLVGFRNFSNAPNNSTFWPQCTYRFCMDLRKNGDYFPLQH